MAKRPAEDDEEDLPPPRKRRYKPKKKEDDDEDEAPRGRRGKQEDEEEDEDEEGSISTGNMYLDIALDFRDDCIDWSKAHLLYAIIIGVVLLLIFSTLSYLFISSWMRYLNRPSLAKVATAYHLGLFPETKLLADYALRYISPNKPEVRSSFLFLQGAAVCAIAETKYLADQRDYYLMAADYLKESARYGFMPGKVAEGWFLLGKSLFHCDEQEQCRLPFELALDEGYFPTKEAYWFLANAYFWGSSPDFNRAEHYLKRFQTEPTALEEEIAESHLLEAMIALQIKGIEEAEAVFDLVPHFERFTIQRSFVEGQIEFFKGRKWRQLTMDLETDPNPNMRMRQSDETMQQSLPIAPAPVSPQVPMVPPSSPTVLPTAPAPVSPMEEATLRQFMRPQPVPLVGVFDRDSEVQQQFAMMRAKYAQNVPDDEMIVLPREDARPAPEPPPIPQDVPLDPVVSDPLLRRVKEWRDITNRHYLRAITLFGEVIRLSDSVSPFGRTARLLTAMSYAEMGDRKTSNDHLRNVMATFPASQEAIVAGFLLGEHDRAAGNLDAAFRSWGDALENIRRNPRYTSFWLPKTAILQRCTAMVREDIEKNHHADVLQLLTMLEGVMPPDDLARLKGETYESWAMLLQSQAETTFGEPGNQLAREVESKRRSAGGAFEELAKLLSDTLEFSDLLWRSAENYRLGKDYRRGIVGYRKFIAANPVGHRPEVNLWLGELYFHLDLLEEASSVLEEALHDFPAHSLTPQLRLTLSHVYYEQKKWDEARALLQLNLIGEASPESASYRDAMYAIGNVSFAQGDLDATIPYLEDAIKVHPNAIQAAEAHYTLAQAYLRQAEKHLSEPTENVPAAARQSLESLALEHRYRALAHFAKTEDILTDRQRVMGLTESEKLMLRNAQFSVCSVLVKMEQYEQVIPRLNALATMYPNRPEALDALLKMAYALRMTGREMEEQTTLRHAEVILNQLEKTGAISDGTNWRNMIQGQMKR